MSAARVTSFKVAREQMSTLVYINTRRESYESMYQPITDATV